MPICECRLPTCHSRRQRAARSPGPGHRVTTTCALYPPLYKRRIIHLCCLSQTGRVTSARRRLDDLKCLQQAYAGLRMMSAGRGVARGRMRFTFLAAGTLGTTSRDDEVVVWRWRRSDTFMAGGEWTQTESHHITRRVHSCTMGSG